MKKILFKRNLLDLSNAFRKQMSNFSYFAPSKTNIRLPIFFSDVATKYEREEDEDVVVGL